METVKEFPVNEISDIHIKSKLSQINIVAGKSENITLRWTDTSRRTTTAKQLGKVLEVMDEGAISFYGILGFMALKENKELTLEVPANFIGSIKAESHDGMIRVFGIEKIGDLTIKTTIGAIEITESNATRVHLSSMGVDISLRGISCNTEIKAETYNGNIDCLITGDKSQFRLDWYTDSGSLNILQAT